MEYNTHKNALRLPEYGRNIQRLIEHAKTVEDRDERNKIALAIIDIMGLLNPHLKNVDDFKHMLWDHLFIMSDFDLDVDSPYPIPERETYKTKPAPFPYPEHTKVARHYGQNVVTLINKATELEEGDKKEEFTQCIANYMKIVYSQFNQNNVSDEIIKNDLQRLSKGLLSLDEETKLNKVKTNNNHRNNRNKNNRNNRNRNKNKNYRNRRKQY